MIIGKPITIGGSGLKPQITVTAPSGSTLDILRNSVIIKTYTLGASETSHTFEVSSLGTYIARATLSSKVKSVEVLVDEITQFSVVISFGRLPIEYTEVEYLQSSGTQYIDTGIILNSNYTVEFKHRLISGTANYEIFGVRDSWYSGGFELWGNTSYSYGYGNSQSDGLATIDVGNDETIKIDKGKFYINDTLIATKSGTPSSTLYCPIFGDNVGGTIYRSWSMRIYWAKFTNNTTLTRNFVPCIRDSDNTAGMYDLVNDVFYDNDGTGVFTTGEPV